MVLDWVYLDIANGDAYLQYHYGVNTCTGLTAVIMSGYIR